MDRCPCGFNPVTMDGGERYCPRCKWTPGSYFKVRRDGVGYYARKFETANEAVEFFATLSTYEPFEIVWFTRDGKVIERRAMARSLPPLDPAEERDWNWRL